MMVASSNIPAGKMLHASIVRALVFVFFSFSEIVLLGPVHGTLGQGPGVETGKAALSQASIQWHQRRGDEWALGSAADAVWITGDRVLAF
jgi:hypothetical protein